MIMAVSSLSTHAKQQFHSQRAPQPASHRQAAPTLGNHNTSLYSQISLKDGSSPPQKSLKNQLIYEPPAHHNFSTHNQPLKMMSASNSRKSNENILLHPNMPPSQRAPGHPPILNINTASDINIYNNSFIVNTN